MAHSRWPSIVLVNEMQTYEYVIFSDCYALTIDVMQRSLWECVVFTLYDAERSFCYSKRKRVHSFLNGGHKNQYLKGFLWKKVSEKNQVRLLGRMNCFEKDSPLLFDVTLLKLNQHSCGFQVTGSMILSEREYLFAPAHSFAIINKICNTRSNDGMRADGNTFGYCIADQKIHVVQTSYKKCAFVGEHQLLFHSLAAGRATCCSLQLHHEFGYYSSYISDCENVSQHRFPGFITRIEEKTPVAIFKKRSVSACK